MNSHMNPQQVTKFLQAALECSVYLAPTDPGLAYEEILEVGKRLGFQVGEIGDALRHATDQPAVGKRFLPHSITVTMWPFYHVNEEPDYRNFEAFDLVCSELKASVRAEGASRAQLERSLIVERAIARQIPRNDIEAAITILVMSGHILEKDGVLRFAQGREHSSLPGEQRNQLARGQPRHNEARSRTYPIVKDVIERRTDGRPKYTEPLDAFAEELDGLGYGHFRLWWKQAVAELRRSDAQSLSVSVSVLSAALVEGALTFVVKRARELHLGVLGSKTFDGNPKTWRIDDLVSSASSGNDSAILDALSRQRAERLILIRQRIHAGRMLSDYPAGVPDLRPEEAREARETAEIVVRRVLDWLEKYPPSRPKS